MSFTLAAHLAYPTLGSSSVDTSGSVFLHKDILPIRSRFDDLEITPTVVQFVAVPMVHFFSVYWEEKKTVKVACLCRITDYVTTVLVA